MPNLPVIPEDLANHFIYGLLISFLAGLVFSVLTLGLWISCLGGWLLAITAAVAKEIEDNARNKRAIALGKSLESGANISLILSAMMGGFVPLLIAITIAILH